MDYNTKPRHQTSKKSIPSKRRHSNHTAEVDVTSVDKSPQNTSNTARKIIPARRRVNKTSATLTKTQKSSIHRNVIVQWNICGLMGKVPELQLIAKQLKPKVIALQETLFDDKKYVDRLDNRKYKWYVQPGRNVTKNGVALAIDKDIPQTQIKLNTELQAVACRTLDKNKMTYVSIYIPPRKITPKKLKTELSKLIKQLPKPFILMGDFNSHSTEWGSFKTDRWGTAVTDVANKLNLHIMNNGKCTRVSKSYTCMSAVDLTIISNKIDSFSWDVDKDCRGSDHLPILIYEKSTLKKSNTKQRWEHNRANWSKFQSTLISKSRNKDITSISELTSDIYEAASVSIPKRRTRVNKNVPWWNDEVANCIKLRKIALRNFQKHIPINSTKIKLAKQLRDAKDNARLVIKKAKKESWKEFLKSINKDENDSRTIWNNIHALSGNNKRRKITLQEGDNIIEDPKKVANKLADYFYEQSATEQYSRYFKQIKRDKENKKLKVRYNTSKAYNTEFSLQELEAALENATGKATGGDGISYEMLRHLPYETKLQLLNEFNKIWTNGGIPNEWKLGLVTPIPKQDNNPHESKNYRPITLLSCIGKTMERMVNTRLITEIEEKMKLNPNQFAFRPGKSTDDYFTELESIISPPIQEDKHVEMALLDISKAYDRAWRRPILEQLTKWNIDGNMIRYVEDFLSNRKFQVEIDDIKSEEKSQENGIPQGAVLSVTLFLIAMNSIEITYKKKNKHIQVKILVYADDILIIVIGNIKQKIRAHLQKVVTRVYKWARNRGFTIAPNKSKILHICKLNKHSKKISNITIEDQIIPQVKYAKLLGITIDSRLNFKQHMVELRKEVKNRCNMIKAIGGRYKGANRRTMLNVFNSLVLSKILYGAHFYSMGDQNQWSIIEPSYNQTIRTITGALRTSPVTSILAETGVIPLKTHIKLNTIKKAIKWLELHNQINENDTPLCKRANLFALELTNEKIPRIAKRFDPIGKRWYDPKVKIDQSTKHKLRAGEQQSIVSKVFLETLNKYSNHNKIYTDGSVKDDETGCGIHMDSHDVPIKLNNMCTIFSAESYALMIASKEAAKMKKPSIIFTDSAGCISALMKGKSQHPWIENIHKTAINSNNSITFCWIPSHVGIKGNEIADNIAEKGRIEGNLHEEVPAHDAAHWFNTRTKWAHEYIWRRTNKSFLRQSKPTTLPWTDRKTIRDQRILTRLRIGHTWLSHGYLLHKEDPPECDSCRIPLTMDHIIRMCPKYDTSRKKFKITGLSIYNNNDTNERNLLGFLHENNFMDKI